MELALYCPNLGYYERTDGSPGRAGDFYTSVSVGSLFGELLAAQFAEWLDALPEPRQIVEAAAHDGQLAFDLWKWLQAHRPDLLPALEYWILEPSARRRESQRQKLKGICNQARWFNDWKSIPAGGICGVIFSNELLDAMPVHRLGWDAKKKAWFEWGVVVEGGGFAWKRMLEMESTKVPENLPSELLAVLPEGFTTELSPAAKEWWSNAASALNAGKLITLDYGLTGEQFFTPRRKDGTLRAYHHHRRSDQILANPGEQDLTAHVNFTEVITAGEGGGLETEFFGPQGRFLTGVLERTPTKLQEPGIWPPACSRQFQTLTHPEHLGHFFQVLIQSTRPRTMRSFLDGLPQKDRAPAGPRD